jgi:hypothetical protein
MAKKMVVQRSCGSANNGLIWTQGHYYIFLSADYR